jgi:hypothetical protein
MLASFKAPDAASGTQVLVADSPQGPFVRGPDGLVTLHQPNRTPLERSVFAEIVETEDSVRLAQEASAPSASSIGAVNCAS